MNVRVVSIGKAIGVLQAGRAQHLLSVDTAAPEDQPSAEIALQVADLVGHQGIGAIAPGGPP